jgi:hypothetical protein
MDRSIEKRIQRMLPLLDEKQKRIYLAAEVEGLDWGGLTAVHELTGVSKTTIIRGKKGVKKNCKRVILSGTASTEAAPEQTLF